MGEILSFRTLRLLPFVIIMLLQGCSKVEIIPDNQIIKENVRLNDRQRLKHDDPYEINNVLQALKNLRAADPSISENEIKPNNVYLRFLPENENELETLKKDTSLVLFDYPLDGYTEEGELSVDDSKGDAHYTWQYCVIPIGKELPAVHHEVIYEIFIPPVVEYATKSTAGENENFYDQLINESARITGNIPVNDTSDYKTARSSSGRWTPKGRIRVWDDLLGIYIPLHHVKVHARWFTHVETNLTDEEGYFKMKSFSHEVNYSIKWENTLFTIRDGLFMQAWYNGPKKKGDWMLDIRNGKSKMFATIHRAAYRQFYGDNLGLSRPSLRTGGRTKICYMEADGTGKFLGDFSAGGILPDIQVWGNGNNRLTNLIFGTTSHELGHQLHSQYIGNLKFFRVSDMIRESWAEAVEWAITNDEYHKLGAKYGIETGIRYDHQYSMHNNWPLVNDKNYSPIFIDLMDSINQREAEGPGHPNDLITDYTPSYINYNLLMNTTDINSLRQEIEKHKLYDVDDYKIQQLFMLY